MKRLGSIVSLVALLAVLCVAQVYAQPPTKRGTSIDKAPTASQATNQVKVAATSIDLEITTRENSGAIFNLDAVARQSFGRLTIVKDSKAEYRPFTFRPLKMSEIPPANPPAITRRE